MDTNWKQVELISNMSNIQIAFNFQSEFMKAQRSYELSWEAAWLKAQVAKHPWQQCKIIAVWVFLNLLNKCFILYDLQCFLRKVQIIGLV